MLFSKKKLKRIRYHHSTVYDGDTFTIWNEHLLSIKCRIEGIDCDEMDDKNNSRAKNQRDLLAKEFNRWFFKPKVLGCIGYRRATKLPYYKKCGRGRYLVRVRIFRLYRHVDYSMFMVRTGQVKKESKWNEND